MTAPWGVVLDKHVFSLILDNLFPLLSNKDGEIALFFRDVFTLEVWLKLAILEVLDVRLNALSVDSGDITFPNILEHVLGWVKETNAWQILFLDSNKVGKTGLDTLSNTRGHKENLTIEFFGSSSEC